MKNALIVLVAVGVVAVAAISPLGITTKFRYLTVADGKAYFSDATVNRTWFEAKAYCESQGMRMAKVENDSQYYALRGVYNETTFRGQFWTAGRDSLRRTQFIWDEQGTPPIQNETDWFFSANVNFQFQTCVVFHHLVSHAILAADLCTEHKQTFCEVEVNERH